MDKRIIRPPERYVFADIILYALSNAKEVNQDKLKTCKSNDEQWKEIIEPSYLRWNGFTKNELDLVTYIEACR